MKVYVDELPKCCGHCPCFAWEERECLASEEDNLWHKNRIDAYRFRHNKCPLQTLAEHDKQVRKEVVQEIREELNSWYDGYEEEYCIHKECLEDILKEAENPCKKS